jgi:CopG family nickel-responsive transcriptional regulator
MVIVSISLNDKILEDIDNIQKEYGYSGRSEVIRAGARLLIAENKEKDKLSGNINSLLLLIHNQDAESTVSDIKHNYENITKTQIHSHLHGNKCLEIFILEGDADSIKSIFRNFQVCKKMDYVKLITA